MQKVIVGGGSGFVGHQIVKTLLNNNYQVVVLTRNINHAKQTLLADQNIQQFQSQLQYQTWNTLDQLMDDKSICGGINLSGTPIMSSRWTQQAKKQFYSSRIETTTQMIQFLSQNNEHGVFVGSSAVGRYPVDQQNIVFDDFTHLSTPNNPLAELCAAVEDTIDSQTKQSGNISSSVIRPGIVLGDSGGALLSLAIPFMLGFTFYPHHGNQSVPFIHVKDLANMYQFVLENHRTNKRSIVEGPVDAVAPQIITFRDFSKSLSKVLNRSFLPLVPIPAFALRLAQGEERAMLLNEGQKVHPAKALKAGFHFQYPTIDSALQDVTKDLSLIGAIKTLIKQGM
jgi:uncharacterized protein (TIGR01777 family)